MCVECDKKFNLTSGLEIAGHEVSQQSHFAEQYLNKERTGFMCVDCDKKFHLTFGLESAGYEVSQQSHFAEVF